MGDTFNGYTKEEWVYDVGCELTNLMAGEYPDDGDTLPYGIRVMLDEFEGLVTQNLQMVGEEGKWATIVPDEMVQRWASLRVSPDWREDAKTGA